MSISIDEMRFTTIKGWKKRLYAVAIAADNLGKVVVTEPPASVVIRHRPNKGRPGLWDFAGDGFSIYHRLGGLPDIIFAHLMVVRDKGGTRRAGETIKEIAESDAAKSTISTVSNKLASAAAGLALILPVVKLIGGLLAKKKDKILWATSGSLLMTEERKEQSALAETVRLPGGDLGDLDVDMDVFLFDAVADEDDLIDTSEAESRLKADGLLFTDSAAQGASS